MNKKDTDGDTARHWASNNNSTDVVRLLLQYGAFTDVKNSYGETPIDYARRKETLRLLQHY